MARRPDRPAAARASAAQPASREPEEFPISSYGRQRLLDTALRLFDDRGIDGVSARTIAQEAGHRNVAAVNYHFGSLEELVRAVLARRTAEIDMKRNALLDQLEAAGPVEPRAALRAMVSPMVDLLDEPDGRRHIRLMAQAANHPDFHGNTSTNFISSLARGALHLLPLVEHLPPTQRAYRTQNILGLALYALAEHSRLLDAHPPERKPLDKAAFTDEILDTLLGTLHGHA